MKRFIICIAILIFPLSTLADKDTPVVAVSCFRNTDRIPVCQVKKKTYSVNKFIQEIPKLSRVSSYQSKIRFTVALDFPSGDFLKMLSKAQSARFTDIEVMTPNSLPSSLVEKMPRKKVGFKLLTSPKKKDN